MTGRRLGQEDPGPPKRTYLGCSDEDQEWHNNVEGQNQNQDEDEGKQEVANQSGDALKNTRAPDIEYGDRPTLHHEPIENLHRNLLGKMVKRKHHGVRVCSIASFPNNVKRMLAILNSPVRVFR
jgi:hypothetical protein